MTENFTNNAILEKMRLNGNVHLLFHYDQLKIYKASPFSYIFWAGQFCITRGKG